MKIFYYIVYVIYKGYDKLSPPKHDYYQQMIYAVSFLDMLIILIIFDLLIARSSIKLSDNKIYIFSICIIIFIFHYFIFRNKQWWLNKFLEFDKLPKKINIVLAFIVGMFITSVFIYFIWMIQNGYKDI